MWRSLRPGIVALGLAVLSGLAGPVRADGFLSCVDHLPLAPGLVEAADGCLNFDTAAGRVVQAEARGAVPVAAVRRFYRAALPAFGWELPDPEALDATRAGERLKISVEAAAGGGVRVHYALAPSPGT